MMVMMMMMTVQSEVDNASEFPGVLKRFEEWMAARGLGTTHTFAIITDGSVSTAYCFIFLPNIPPSPLHPTSTLPPSHSSTSTTPIPPTALNVLPNIPHSPQYVGVRE
jgi:hypothetical protein